MRKMVATITPEMQQASEKFVSNWKDMETAVDGFVTNTLGPRLPQITGMLDGLNKAIETMSKKGVLQGIIELDQKLPVPFGPMAGIEGIGPADPSYAKRQRAEQLRRQIENADGQIGLIEGRGGDARIARARRDDLSDQLRRLTEELRALRGTGGAATITPSAFDGGGGFAGMIQRAALGGGGGFGGSPFSAGFWSNVYRGGVGGDPFRGGGRTWDRSGGGGGGGGSGDGSPAGRIGVGGDAGRFTPSSHRPAEAAGKYRPEYKLSDADATGSVNITLSGGLEKMPARVSMDGLFRDVKVNRRVSLMDTGDGSP